MLGKWFGRLRDPWATLWSPVLVSVTIFGVKLYFRFQTMTSVTLNFFSSTFRNHMTVYTCKVTNSLARPVQLNVR